MSDIIDEHRLYLSDGPRLAAYEAALSEVVRPGDVVVDLGAGSGILGMLACRAGAGKVYALEQTSLIDLTRRIAADNGLSDRIVHIKAASTHTALPERADVVCCDQIGRFGFEAGVFGYFADAARRFAKADARFVPSHIEMWFAPVAFPERAADVAFWEQPRAGFDVSAAKSTARNSGYPCLLQAEHLLGDGAMLARQSTKVEEGFQGEAEVTVRRAGVFDGIGAWFRAELAPDTFVTNSPESADRIQRRNVLLPIEKAIEVSEGDRVSVRIHVIPRETLLSWQVRVTRADGSVALESRHSTFQGMFLSKEDLRVTAPSSIPVLSAWGEARKTVLELCDGARPLNEVEKGVAERHADLFPTLREASCFVAEVVTRYAT